MGAVSLSLMRHAEPAIDSNRSVIHHLRKSGIFRDYQRAFEISLGQSLALRQVGSFQSPLHGSRRTNPFCELISANYSRRRPAYLLRAIWPGCGLKPQSRCCPPPTREYRRQHTRRASNRCLSSTGCSGRSLVNLRRSFGRSCKAT